MVRSLQAGEWFMVAVAVLWAGAAVAHAYHKRWAEAVLAATFCASTAMLVYLQVRR